MLCLSGLVGASRAQAASQQREIAAVSRSQSSDLFAIDADFSIKHYHRPPQAKQFSGVVQLDGLARDVAAVERGDGNFEVFVVGMGGDVWSNRQLGRARWRGFRLMGFHCKQIAVTKTRAGRYELFVIGKDDVVYRSVRDGDDGAWSAWQSLQRTATQLSAASDGDTVRIFVVGEDRAVWTSDSARVQWSRLGGKVHDVAARGEHDGRMTVFASDDQGRVWQREGLASGQFQPWKQLPGSATRLAAPDHVSGAQPVFALGTRLTELDPQTQRWQTLNDKLPLELTFYGVATVALPALNIVQKQALQIGVRFSTDHRRVTVIDFPQFTTKPFKTPFGTNRTTVSLASARPGTFDPETGRVELQVTLHLDQSLDVPFIEEDTDVTLTLTTDGAKPLSQGRLFAETELVGTGPLVARNGMSPLAGMQCQVTATGYFTTPASLLLVSS